jgi:predicted ArsR family transcriptional regulator
MERHKPNKTKQMILKHLSPEGSASTVQAIATALGLSRHGAAMCVLRLQRQYLIRRLDVKEDPGQYPRRYQLTPKGKDRLRFYESQDQTEEEVKE